MWGLDLWRFEDVLRCGDWICEVLEIQDVDIVYVEIGFVEMWKFERYGDVEMLKHLKTLCVPWIICRILLLPNRYDLSNRDSLLRIS